MKTDNYVIRRMGRHEIDFAIELAGKEGRNPGIHDAECFYAADPDGFLLGLLDDKPIASLSAVKYGDSYGFLGLYFVRHEYRGRGFGLQIWEEGMKCLAGRDVGFDGVIEQTGNYARSGFELAYYSTRYEGKAVGSSGNKGADPRIIELSRVPFESLRAYDDTLVPASRPEFLRCWICQPQSIALGIIEDGQLVGYTVLRRCLVGYKIGPLFADDETLAEALFQVLSSRVSQGTPIFLDVPGENKNPAAAALARRHGMRKVFETVRMYRMWTEEEMRLPLDRWFGVTTLELG
jgi:GNAT superfamily N-acetyltransferase